MVHVRFGSPADAKAIAGVRGESWRAAYTGIIPDAILDREVRGYDAGRVRRAFASRPWQRVLVAERPVGPLAPPAGPLAPIAAPVPAGTAPFAVVGYATFGPERGLDGRPRTARGSPRPAQGRTAELYALYVTPACWSTGTGRALMDRVLAEAQAEGYPRIVLWVLEQNARARRFYERSRFQLSGRAHQLGWLGGVPEVCYVRALAPVPG